MSRLGDVFLVSVLATSATPTVFVVLKAPHVLINWRILAASIPLNTPERPIKTASFENSLVKKKNVPAYEAMFTLPIFTGQKKPEQTQGVQRTAPSVANPRTSGQQYMAGAFRSMSRSDNRMEPSWQGGTPVYAMFVGLQTP